MSNCLSSRHSDHYLLDRVYSPVCANCASSDRLDQEKGGQFYIVYPLVFIVLQRHRRLIRRPCSGSGWRRSPSRTC